MVQMYKISRNIDGLDTSKMFKINISNTIARTSSLSKLDSMTIGKHNANKFKPSFY